jgi:anaerobic selenocysteine-containing dehydrogenase
VRSSLLASRGVSGIFHTMPSPSAPLTPPRQSFRTCTLCEAMCGLVITTEGDRVVDIRGDADDPLSKGHLCPKAVALQDIHTDPDRIRHPMKRVGTEWQRIGWGEAIALAVRGIQSVQRTHGRDAVAAYVGNPTVHSLGAMLFVGDFLRSLRTRNRYSATSVDQLPAHVAAMYMFGHALLIPIPDLDRTDHFLVFGANPAVSNGSLMTAPGAAERIKAIRARGGRVVVIDPRRTETAALADAHYAIRPGTDALLLLAMLQVIFAEGLERPGHLTAVIDGVEALREESARFTPDRVAAATGIAAETIRALARDFARARTAVAYGRVGVSMQEFGGLATWLITALNIVCGRLDTSGGAMFTSPAVDLLRADQRRDGRPRFGRWKSRVRGLPEFAGELPVAALAEEIETPGPGQVRGFVTHGGNPVLSTPNGARLDAALAQMEFYVAIDFYLNETTRHAHLILPPSSPLEREHYDLIFHTLAVRDTAKYSAPVFRKPAESRHEWEIMNAITTRLNRGIAAKARGAALAIGGPSLMLDYALRSGPYGKGFLPLGRGLSLRALKRAPHGVDLGPLKPSLLRKLRTKDRRIDAAPALFVADIARLESRWLEGGEAAVSRAPEDLGAGGSEGPGPLALIGRRATRSSNSWMHNVERLTRGRNRCTLLMHPSDAEARSLRDGTIVRITARVGTVDAELAVSDEMMPGVVSLPHGWGHGRVGTRMRVAAGHPGVSINDLTDDQAVDALTGNAAFSGVAVHVVPHVVPAVP